MIKGEEVRLGNMVEAYKGSHRPVASIGMGRVGFNNFGMGKEPVSISFYDYEQISAIELTVEWVIALGFKHSYSEQSGKETHKIYSIQFGTEDEKIEFNNTTLEVETCADDDPFYGNKLPHIKYVHQLQNLYFALTGKELTK